MENLEQILISKDPELKKAKEFGIDTVALYDNLNRTPTERIRRPQIAVDTLRRLRNTSNKTSEVEKRKEKT